jgi:hypothetical protein
LSNNNTYEAVVEALSNGAESVELYLHDDIGIVAAPDLDSKSREEINNQRMMEVESEDDFYEQVHINCFYSKKYNCRVGNAGCCFCGVIIMETYESNETDNSNLEDKISNATKWVNEMQAVGRIPMTVELRMRANCCS